MSKLLAPLGAIAVLLAFALVPTLPAAAPTVFKCTVDGAVTYQSTPCPSGEARPAPTAEQLNAARRKKLQQAASAPVAPDAVPAASRGPAPGAGASQPLANKPRR